MQTYQYKCQECGHKFEVLQKLCDSALKFCPICEGKIKKYTKRRISKFVAWGTIRMGESNAKNK